jgi:hypothetical protein
MKGYMEALCYLEIGSRNMGHLTAPGRNEFDDEKHGRQKSSAVLYGNTTLQSTYFWSVLGLSDFLQRYLCKPFENTKSAPLVVRIYVG